MMRKLLMLGFGAAMIFSASEAYATWDYLYDQCAAGYTYMKGPKSSWPAWAQSDGCVRPWSENPMAPTAASGGSHHKIKQNSF
jgi:hypothetical protein